jgi:hypothetical protein
VGPVYRGGQRGEAEQLRLCYINSLKRAVENNCDSIAFPLISSGIFGYPKAEALHVATAAIRDFLEDHDLTVYLAVFDREAFVVSQELLDAVESYIDEHYVAAHTQNRRQLLDIERELLESSAPVMRPVPLYSKRRPADAEELDDTGIEALINDLDEPFSETLLRLIDARGKTDAEVYKRANIDRRLFSKSEPAKVTIRQRTPSLPWPWPWSCPFLRQTISWNGPATPCLAVTSLT